MLDNDNIKIAILETGPQEKAILDFYFDSVGKDLYSVVSEGTSESSIKESADALIIDYDLPEAKETVSELTSNSRSSIIILSDNDPNIPSTVWVAKPLTAAALTEAATSIKQLHNDNNNQTTDIESSNDDDLDKLINDISIDANVDNETSLENNAEIEIEEVETKENNSLNSELTLPISAATASLVSDTEDLNDELDDDLDDELDEFGLEQSNHQDDTKDNLEFNELLNEEKNTDSESENSDTEMDDLLDSLLQESNDETDEQVQEIKAISESEEDDIFRESLALDSETKDIADTSEQILETSFSTKLVKPDVKINADPFESLDNESEEVLSEETQTGAPELENINLEDIDLDDVDLNEPELLTESIPLEDDEIITTDKQSILLDENVIRHVDPNAANETVYAETLILSYDEVKAETKENTIDELELESNKSEELKSETDDIPANKTLFNELSDEDLEPNAKNEPDFETSFGAINKPEISLNKNSKEVELETNENLDTDLDSLLNEISNEADSFNPEQKSTTDTNPIIAESAPLEASIVDKKDTKAEGVDLSDSDLQSLLNEVRQEATKDSDDGLGSNDNLDGVSSTEKTAAETRWIQLCGNLDNIKRQKDVAKISFNVEEHLLGAVLKLVESVNNTEQLYRLKYHDLVIVLDKPKDRIYCNFELTDDDYSAVCFNEIDAKNIKIHDLDYSEIRLYHSKSSKHPERVHTFESFIWLTSLLTSRGRLPENTEVNKTLGLRIWPNLTRLELTPHAMQIAAALSKHSGSLIETSNFLKIDQRYVFAFYNAAFHLGMIESDSNKLKQSASGFSKKSTSKKSKDNSFFGGLFKKLKT